MAFEKIEPERDDLRATIIAQTVAQGTGLKKKDGQPLRPSDFGLLPETEATAPRRFPSWQSAKVAFLQAFGGQPPPATTGSA